MIADNKLSGIEFYLTNFTKEDVQVKNCTIIGQSQNNA